MNNQLLAANLLRRALSHSQSGSAPSPTPSSTQSQTTCPTTSTTNNAQRIALASTQYFAPYPSNRGGGGAGQRVYRRYGRAENQVTPCILQF